MYLYHLTLQAPTAIQSTVVGNFTGATSKSQEILTVKGTTILELLKVDSATGKVKILATLDTFSVIRSVTSFKLPGDDKGKVEMSTLIYVNLCFRIHCRRK